MNKEEIRAIIREVLPEEIKRLFMKYLGISQQPSARREWYTARDAYEKLGYDNPEQLREAVRSGLFRKGTEVRDERKPNAKRASYRFHINKCLDRLAQRPEKRHPRR